MPLSPSAETPANIGQVLEVNGPSQLATSGKELLEGADDLLIVRDLVADPDVLKKILEEQYSNTPLYEAIPELYDLDQVVQDFWQQHGYSDFQLESDKLESTGISPREGIGIHTDYRELRGPLLSGPLLLSLGVAGSGTFFAERPATSHRKHTDNSFDQSAWASWTNSKNQFREPPTNLASHSQQRAGDGVIIVNHPGQTFHAVTVSPEDGPRRSILYDYKIRRSK